MTDPTATSVSLLTEIDHVAIAVNDLEAAIDWYAEVFGATVEHRERVESDGVEEALLKVADSYVQLLTPVNDTSPVAKYLANKGEGLHHIGYRVDDDDASYLVTQRVVIFWPFNEQGQMLGEDGYANLDPLSARLLTDEELPDAYRRLFAGAN